MGSRQNVNLLTSGIQRGEVNCPGGSKHPIYSFTPPPHWEGFRNPKNTCCCSSCNSPCSSSSAICNTCPTLVIQGPPRGSAVPPRDNQEHQQCHPGITKGASSAIQGPPREPAVPSRDHQEDQQCHPGSTKRTSSARQGDQQCHPVTHKRISSATQ